MKRIVWRTSSWAKIETKEESEVQKKSESGGRRKEVAHNISGTIAILAGQKLGEKKTPEDKSPDGSLWEVERFWVAFGLFKMENCSLEAEALKNIRQRDERRNSGSKSVIISVQTESFVKH